MPIQYQEIIKHDFNSLFALDDGNIATAITNISAPEFVEIVFGPFRENIVQDTEWIAANWESARHYYDITPEPQNLQNDQIAITLDIPDPITIDHLQYFFSQRQQPHRHWHMGQAHTSLYNHFPAQNLQHARQILDEKKNIISGLGTFVINENNILQKIYQNNFNYPVLTVLPHLIYPYIFPVWFRRTPSGYSQIASMHRLLDDFCFHADYIRKRPDLTFETNYDHYSAAYRFLLNLYQIWRGGECANPHFDYFTELLLNLDPKAMPKKMLEMKKALILYGVPGTGKTHTAKKIANGIADPHNIKFVQFHPNYSYSDFIIGIKPETTQNGGITYPTVPGLLYRVAAEAHHLGNLPEGKKEEERKNPNVVLIIDEINRANLAAVLGEVMYSLEYRGETVTLPQTLSTGAAISRVPGLDNPQGEARPLDDPFDGGRRFMLPANLFIIGTMNHADRSIAGFDMALRRRFAWYRTEPNYDVLPTMINEKKGNPQITSGSLEAFVKRANSLNETIASGDGEPDSPLTQDHLVGHSYFAEIGSIVRAESPNSTTIDRYHRELLWLYYIKPLLEDFLGSDARHSSSVLETLKKILVDDLR